MNRILKKTGMIIALYVSILSSAISASFTVDTPYQVCFTPGQNCTNLIVKKIDNAKQSVYVQAYSFTSAPIASALISAKRRGLDVRVLLDKSQIKNNTYSSAKFLMNNKIKTWIDYKPAIAHNKIILIDNKVVITGSFNFTKAAEKRNAENLLIIENRDLAESYYLNWTRRQQLSKSPEEYLDRKAY